MGHTSDTLFEAIDANNFGLLSNGAKCDYGLDSQSDLFFVYRDTLNKGYISRLELKAAVADGPALTDLINRNPDYALVRVQTAWDMMELPDE